MPTAWTSSRRRRTRRSRARTGAFLVSGCDNATLLGGSRPVTSSFCSMTRLSRRIGLEVVDGPFVDEAPIFYPDSDPFVVRFHVRPLVWLPVEKAVPIHGERVWHQLSFTRGQSKRSSSWTGKLRGSLVQLDDADGFFLESLIRGQVDGGETYPVDPNEFRQLATHRVRRADKDVTVTVREGIEVDEEEAGRRTSRHPADVPDARRISIGRASSGSGREDRASTSGGGRGGNHDRAG